MIYIDRRTHLMIISSPATTDASSRLSPKTSKLGNDRHSYGTA